MALNIKAAVEWAESNLGNLPTVSLGKVSLIALDWATLALVIALCVWKDTTDSVPVLNGWLVFLAALHGVSYANFRTAVLSPTTTPAGLAMQNTGPPAPAPDPVPAVAPAATP